jgi:hypothetical protein
MVAEIGAQAHFNPNKKKYELGERNSADPADKSAYIKFCFA